MKEAGPVCVRKRADEVINRTREHYGLSGEDEGLSGLSRMVRRELHRELQQQRKPQPDMVPSRRLNRVETASHPR